MSKLSFPLLLGMLITAVAAENDDPLMRAAGTREYRPPKETVETLATIEIGKNEGRLLNATVFRPRVPPAGLMPAIVFIHGGGWRQGSHYNLFSAWMAERGYLVASIDYRLAKEAHWPAQIRDCKTGIRWLRSHAAEYHIDPNRIGVWGTSAGGYLSACVGIMPDAPDLAGEGFEGVSSTVQAVAVFCGPTDFTGDWLKPGSPYPEVVINLLGVSREENPALWKQASPAQQVGSEAPPFLIVHGTDDTAVPFTQAEKLKLALEAAGHSVEWLPVKNGHHDFFLNSTTPESTIQPNHETIMATLLEFFDRHLKKSQSPE
ncbi:alpha/beta hydrolase [soil metagenome]